MIGERDRIEALLARYVEHHVLHGERLSVSELCDQAPELVELVRAAVSRYHGLDETLDDADGPGDVATGNLDLPEFEGFQTIERLGAGGAGEVYKLRDRELGRTVAAKVIRRGNRLGAGFEEFLREARALALFDDPRIVRIFEFRRRAVPAFLLMEHVDGFDLMRTGRSLEYRQRAAVMAEVAEAIQHAHDLGIQHRDLKPGNILLDAGLRPKILDFGLSGGDPGQGHGVGTPAYMAPERFDSRQPIDARSDTYSLGVILYELLCGELPYTADSAAEWVRVVREAAPRLPAEVEPSVPEPLQAIALKAMARSPGDRYASAREMALDLRRYLDAKPVVARPMLYQSTLARRVRPHLEQIREWVRIRLIWPHEADRLAGAYRRLEAREDDWIVGSRRLSLSQIVLYFGAFLLVCGSLLYFVAYFHDAIRGLAGPLLVLGLPFAGLNVAAHVLYRRRQRAVAVAFHLAAVGLLPLLLLIAMQETGLWQAVAGGERELFGGDSVSNRQLQLAGFVACVWAAWLALSTRTVALGSCFTVLAVLFNLAVLTDFGLRGWFEDGRYDLLALHLIPALVVFGGLGAGFEAQCRDWLARPLYVAGVLLFILIPELLALDGRAFGYLGITTRGLQGSGVEDPVLLDTVAAMTLTGFAFYGAAWLMERKGTPLMRLPAWLLFAIAPFAILQPLSYLAWLGTFSRRYDWLYLVLAVGIALLSHVQQRKSFYFAGVLNTGAALWYITSHNDWFDRPLWSALVGAAGVVALILGLGLDAHASRRRH